MVDINPRDLSLRSQGFKTISLKSVGLALLCNQIFVDPDGNMSGKGYFIDDYIYVLS